MPITPPPPPPSPRKRTKTDEGERLLFARRPRPATILDLPDVALRIIGSLLSPPSRATFAVAMCRRLSEPSAALSRIAKNGVSVVIMELGTSVFSIMGGDEETGGLVGSDWNTLDFSEDMELASKIDDDDIAAVLCIASAQNHLKHLKLPPLKDGVTGRGLTLLRYSTVLETLDMDPERSYEWPDTRYTKEEVTNIVDAILALEGNSFRRLRSPGPNFARDKASLLSNRVGLTNVNSGCVTFGFTWDDLNNTVDFDLDMDQCYTCNDINVNACVTCDKSLMCGNANCCDHRDILMCQGTRMGGRSCTKFQCEGCKDRDDAVRGREVIECNQTEGREGRHHLCLPCMQRRCKMHADDEYMQTQVQAGVDPGPYCRHCTSYVLRDCFATSNQNENRMRAIRDLVVGDAR